MRVVGVGLGDDIDNGIPRNTARDAAREKLRTAVMEMIVDAKHRLRALSTTGKGPAVILRLGGMKRDVRGSVDIMAKRMGETTCSAKRIS